MLNLAKLANRTWVPKLVTSEVYRISATLLARGKLQSVVAQRRICGKGNLQVFGNPEHKTQSEYSMHSSVDRCQNR